MARLHERRRKPIPEWSRSGEAVGRCLSSTSSSPAPGTGPRTKDSRAARGGHRAFRAHSYMCDRRIAAVGVRRGLCRSSSCRRRWRTRGRRRALPRPGDTCRSARCSACRSRTRPVRNRRRRDPARTTPCWPGPRRRSRAYCCRRCAAPRFVTRTVYTCNAPGMLFGFVVALTGSLHTATDLRCVRLGPDC